MHEFELGQYKELGLQSSPMFTESELDEAVIVSVLELANNWYKENKAIEPWDEVIVNMAAKCEELFVPELSREDYKYTVGNPSMLQEFSIVIGKKKGDQFQIEMKLPQDVLIERIAGKTVIIEGAIIDVIPPKKKVEITDDIAKQIDSEVSSIEELKSKLSKIITVNWLETIRENNVAIVLDTIWANSHYKLDEEEFQKIFKEVLDTTQRQMLNFANRNQILQANMQQDKLLQEDCKILAEKMIVHGLVLNEVISREGITVTEDEAKGKKEDLLKDLDESALTKYFPDQKSVCDYLLREKVLELLLQLNINSMQKLENSL